MACSTRPTCGCMTCSSRRRTGRTSLGMTRRSSCCRSRWIPRQDPGTGAAELHRFRQRCGYPITPAQHAATGVTAVGYDAERHLGAAEPSHDHHRLGLVHGPEVVCRGCSPVASMPTSASRAATTVPGRPSAPTWCTLPGILQTLPTGLVGRYKWKDDPRGADGPMSVSPVCGAAGPSCRTVERSVRARHPGAPRATPAGLTTRWATYRPTTTTSLGSRIRSSRPSATGTPTTSTTRSGT